MIDFLQFILLAYISIFARIEDQSESISEKEPESKDQKQNDETEISIPAVITTSSLDNGGRFLTQFCSKFSSYYHQGTHNQVHIFLLTISLVFSASFYFLFIFKFFKFLHFCMRGKRKSVFI